MARRELERRSVARQGMSGPWLAYSGRQPGAQPDEDIGGVAAAEPLDFTRTNPAMLGFTPGGFRVAGGLLSTTSAPRELGAARLHRYAEGTWDSTTDTPTHAGSAGP